MEYLKSDSVLLFSAILLSHCTLDIMNVDGEMGK